MFWPANAMLPCHPTPPNISYNFKMLLEPQMYDIKHNQMLIGPKLCCNVKGKRYPNTFNNGIDQDTTQLKNV
jgi:hypothetical protein